MFRWLTLPILTGCLAVIAISAHAASASLICETAPRIRFLERAKGYPTRADAEAAVRARCRQAALTFHARAATPERSPQRPMSEPSPRTPPIQERACRRYPNLC
jgi:hypothetical protein